MVQKGHLECMFLDLKKKRDKKFLSRKFKTVQTLTITFW